VLAELETPKVVKAPSQASWISVLCEVTMFVERQEARLEFGNDFVIIWESLTGENRLGKK
jgi:hypothetical protein